MIIDIKKILKKEGLLLIDKIEMIENGSGFRIQDFRFNCKKNTDRIWQYVSEESNLETLITIKQVQTTIVISSQLKNTGDCPTPPINTLEPLRIVFNQSCDKWRHIYLAGGTSEGCYPPEAYRKTDRAYDSSRLKIESHPDGYSSNLYLPLLMSLFSADEESEGIYCGLEWSGLWFINFEEEEKGKSCLSVGIKVNGLQLKPNEVLNLPYVHIGFFKGGSVEGSNVLREYIYNHICAKYKKEPVIPPVSYNHWQTKLSFESLKKQADRAAEIGMEVFIIDAGWFQGGYPYGMGNWDKVDLEKFPRGLESLADYVQKLGMDLGIWFVPERAYENTTVFKEHPDWFILPPEGQISEDSVHDVPHLDFGILEAQNYFIELLGRYIERLDLRWIKWDYYGSPFVTSFFLENQFEYYKGLYRVLDTIMEKYPNLRIEWCSSGGRRIDLATIRRAHTLWLSDAYGFDHNHLLSRYMQARANYFLPGQLLLTWVTIKPDQESKGVNNTDILSSMIGALGFNGDIACLSGKQLENIKYWINEYKQIRHLVVQQFYQVLPTPASIEDWDALQFTNRDSTESALFVYAGNKSGKRSIVLKGLGANETYKVENRVDISECTIEGSKLIQEGLTIELDAFGCGLWRINRI